MLGDERHNTGVQALIIHLAEKNGGCIVNNEGLKTVAGPLIKTAIENRNNCRQNKCSGHGRCVDYNMKRLDKICITSNNNRSSSNLAII